MLRKYMRGGKYNDNNKAKDFVTKNKVKKIFLFI